MVAAAAESSLARSIRVPGYRTCHSGSIKASAEITRRWPPVHTGPTPAWVACELFIILPVLSYVFFKLSSHFFQVQLEELTLSAIFTADCIPSL